jgi:hypothetical protein
MSTIQDIDREAARRVAVALGEGTEDAGLEDGGLGDPGSSTIGVESPTLPHMPRPATETWREFPRILSLAAAAAAIVGLLAIFGIPGHGRFVRGSLLSGGAMPPRDPPGVQDMKSTIQQVAMVAATSAAVVTRADAQQAVQWQVRDGGNGHWYQVMSVTGSNSPRITWTEAKARAEAAGGHLVAINTPAENSYLFAALSPLMFHQWSCWIGGYRSSGGDWNWVTGEVFSCEALPSGRSCPFDCCENSLYTGSFGTGPYLFVDDHDDGFQGGKEQYLIEWSADCNNDGIVDYGQILSGELVDADTNGVPDACECPCDVFPDNAVNGIDLGVLLGQWGEVTQYTVTDFNRDGAVDGSDLGQLLAAWGPCPG